MIRYLIVGNGRVATHVGHYFKLLQQRFDSPTPALQFDSWSKKINSSTELTTKAALADQILLAISDSALENFVKLNPELKREKCIHFSGVYFSTEIVGAHPLMTFGPHLYDLAAYEKISFIVDHSNRIADILPGLANPKFSISPEKKPLYHALCALSGNFSTLLWEHTISRFANELNLPRAVLLPYLQQITRNLSVEGPSVLTGPMARGDVKTMVAHLDSLSDSPDQKLYYAFLNFYLEQHHSLGELKHEYSRI